jgi:hypothetical protein
VSISHYTGVDPFETVKTDLSPFSDSIRELVDTQHPVLAMAAKHFFERVSCCFSSFQQADHEKTQEA